MNIKVVILAAILLIGSVLAILSDKMTLYMGIFFIVFSSFKLIDVKGFAMGFQKYDILAKKSKEYALLYPFIELTLGIFYLFNFLLLYANIVTIFVMGVGAIGVFQAIRAKQDFTCACLGTKLGIPLTYVTLFENVIMVIMAVMLLL